MNLAIMVLHQTHLDFLYLPVLVTSMAVLDITRLLFLADPGVVRKYRSKAADLARTQPDWDEIARRTEELYLRITHRASEEHQSQASEMTAKR